MTAVPLPTTHLSANVCSLTERFNHPVLDRACCTKSSTNTALCFDTALQVSAPNQHNWYPARQHNCMASGAACTSAGPFASLLISYHLTHPRDGQVYAHARYRLAPLRAKQEKLKRAGPQFTLHCSICSHAVSTIKIADFWLQHNDWG
jgi:hypothetical protein